MKDSEGNYWEEGLYTLKPEQLEYLKETNFKSYSEVSEIFDAYDRGEFWWPGGNIRNIHCIHDRYRWGERREKYRDICGFSNQLTLVVFESLGRLQLIRVLEHLCDEYYSDSGYRRVHEVGRFFLDPKTAQLNTPRFPDSRNNPFETYYPISETDRRHKYAVKLGGYEGHYSPHNLGGTIFWFKSVSPGIEVRRAKKVLTEMWNSSKLPKPDTWGYTHSHHALLGISCFELFLKTSIGRELWARFPEFHDILYSEHACYSELGTIPLYGQPEARKQAVYHLRHGWRPHDTKEILNFEIYGK